MRGDFMRTKKNLMLRLTIVSFALNIASIFLAVLNHAQGKVADTEKIAPQKYQALIDTGNFINVQGSLIKDFGRFPRNILT